MANMSYCRFQNTARDLDDCQDALEELLAGDGAQLSREELRAAQSLVKSCQNILHLIAEAGAADDLELTDTDIDGILNHANTAAGGK